MLRPTERFTGPRFLHLYISNLGIAIFWAGLEGRFVEAQITKNRTRQILELET